MVIRSFTRAVLVIVLAVAGCLGSGTPSRAAQFIGNFDPQFSFDNSVFTNLGYRGQGLFFVPDACLASTGVIIPAAPCAALNGGLVLQSLFVEFYDSTQPFPQTTALTVNFNQAPFALNSVIIQFNAQTNRNELFAVDTDLIGPQSANLSSLSSFVTFPSLFNSAAAFLAIDFDLAVFGEGPPGAFLTLASGCEGFSRDTCTVFETASNPALITFTRVPEPGTLALAFGALSVGLLTRRRFGKNR